MSVEKEREQTVNLPYHLAPIYDSLRKEDHPAAPYLAYLIHSEAPSDSLARGQSRFEIDGPQVTIFTRSTRGFGVVQQIKATSTTVEIGEELFGPKQGVLSLTRRLVAEPWRGWDFRVKEETIFTDGKGRRWEITTTTKSDVNRPEKAIGAASCQDPGVINQQIAIACPNGPLLKLEYLPASDLRLKTVDLPLGYQSVSSGQLSPQLTIGEVPFHLTESATGDRLWITEKKKNVGGMSPVRVELPDRTAETAVWCNDLLSEVYSPQILTPSRQRLLPAAVERLTSLALMMKTAFLQEIEAGFPLGSPESRYAEAAIGECLVAKTIGNVANSRYLLLLIDGGREPLIAGNLPSVLGKTIDTQRQETAVIILTLGRQQRERRVAVVEDIARTQPTDITSLIQVDDGFDRLGRVFTREATGVVQGLAAVSSRGTMEIIFPQIWEQFTKAAGFDPSRDADKLRAVIATDLIVPDGAQLDRREGDLILRNQWPNLFDWARSIPGAKVLLTSVGKGNYESGEIAAFIAQGGRVAPPRRPMIKELLLELIKTQDASSLLQAGGWEDYCRLVDAYWQDPSDISF